MESERFGKHGEIHFLAEPGMVAGDSTRSVEGVAYHSSNGYIFQDKGNRNWWIIFSPNSSTNPDDRERGSVLACSSEPEAGVEVRILAPGVSKVSADIAFLTDPPVSYEDAVRRASAIRK